MKTRLFKIAVFIIVFVCQFHAQKSETTKMVLNGLYTGKNLLVKNTFQSGGLDFNITQINISIQISPAELA